MTHDYTGDRFNHLHHSGGTTDRNNSGQVAHVLMQASVLHQGFCLWRAVDIDQMLYNSYAQVLICCRYMLVEDLLDGGSYVKFNGNNGFVYTPQQAILDARSREESDSGIRLDVQATLLAQAFSHFTFQASGRNEIVVDIQGCGTRWTDPCLHSKTCEYGRTDCGTNGISKFFKTHKCNFWCVFLKLQTVKLDTKEFCRGAC